MRGLHDRFVVVKGGGMRYRQGRCIVAPLIAWLDIARLLRGVGILARAARIALVVAAPIVAVVITARGATVGLPVTAAAAALDQLAVAVDPPLDAAIAIPRDVSLRTLITAIAVLIVPLLSSGSVRRCKERKW